MDIDESELDEILATMQQDDDSLSVVSDEAADPATKKAIQGLVPSVARVGRGELWGTKPSHLPPSMHLPAGSRLQLPRPGLYAKPHSQPIFKNNLLLTNTSGLLLLPRSTISSTWRGTSTEREATQSPLLLFPFPRCHQERTTKPGLE